MKLALKSLSIVLVFMASGLVGIGVAEAELPILHRVDIYLGTTWENMQSYYAPTQLGRHKMVDQSANLLSGNCDDLLTNFQQRPLNAMVTKHAYITPEMRRTFQQLEELGIESSQVVTINQYSEVTEEEARRLFPDPADLKARTLKEPMMEGGEKRQISRGTMWFIRGFQLDPAQLESGNPAALKPKIVPLNLPWEDRKSALPFPLTKRWNRAAVPAVYEIGRTLSEDGPLSGDFKLMAGLIAQVIAQEADILNLDPKTVVLTSHTLKADRARLFALMFGTRILDDTAVRQMELDLKGFMERFQDQPLPKGSEWNKYNNVVSFTSLAAAQERFPLTDFSELAWHTIQTKGVQLNGQNPLGFWRDVNSLFRRDMHFDHPQVGKSSRPLIIGRGMDAFFFQEFMSLASRFGIPIVDFRNQKWDDPVAAVLSQFQSGLDVKFAPDLFLGEWHDRVTYVPPDAQNGENEPARISHMIFNMDPQLAQTRPRDYSAAVILGLWETVEYEIDQLSPGAFNNLKFKINHDRRYRGLPAVNTVEASVFFETYGMALAPVNPVHEAELQNLGGKPLASMKMVLTGNMVQSGYSNKYPDVLELSFAGHPVTLYQFNTREIRVLKTEFPQFSGNARQGLKNGYNKIKLRLYQAPMI